MHYKKQQPTWSKSQATGYRRCPLWQLICLSQSQRAPLNAHESHESPHIIRDNDFRHNSICIGIASICIGADSSFSSGCSNISRTRTRNLVGNVFIEGHGSNARGCEAASSSAAVQPFIDQMGLALLPTNWQTIRFCSRNARTV